MNLGEEQMNLELQHHKKNKKETIKKSEMKDILTEIKNNLQGINCRVDEAENQNNDLEYNEAKKISKKKNESKLMRTV